MDKRKRLRLKIHKPHRISPTGMRSWFPRMFHLPDGVILQNNATVDDTDQALEQKYSGAVRCSRDGGKSWSEMTIPPRYGMPALLQDGRLRSFSYTLWKGPDSALFGMLSDMLPGSNVWTEEERFEVFLPQQAVYGCLPRGMLVEPDGTLLAALYGRWASEPRDRSFLVRSTDSGLTWSYVSTIAGGPASYSEGFNEPVICRGRNGGLVAVMRTGSGYPPLHGCRSDDNGATWSTPHNLGVYSVAPDLCLMSNGILACSFGRPWIQVMFSLDGNGFTWSAPRTILASRGNSTCYTALREVEPGRLLLVYDQNRSGPPWFARDNHIIGVFIDVELG